MEAPIDAYRGQPNVAITGGLVFDGHGSSPLLCDLLISNGSIAELGPKLTIPLDAFVIDARGAAVAPGFIDLHTHADFTISTQPLAPSYVRQGVTTMVVGNCGMSPFPCHSQTTESHLRAKSGLFATSTPPIVDSVASFAKDLRGLPLGPNVAPLVGHGSAHLDAVGNTPSSGASDLHALERTVHEQLEQGAFGVSLGLIYSPSAYATREDLLAVGKAVAAHDGFVASHMRNEGASVIDSVNEMIFVAEQTGAAVHISHHKILGRRNEGLSQKTLEAIDAAQSRGHDVTLDMYPYEATSTTITALVPQWILAGSQEEVQLRLRDQTVIDEALATMRGPMTDVGHYESDSIVLAGIPGHHFEYAGARLIDVARDFGVSPEEAVLQLVSEHGSSIQILKFNVSVRDMTAILAHPKASIASDGWVLAPDPALRPHPRSFGTFAKVLSTAFRHAHGLTLAKTIEKITSLPASRLGLTDRGRIAKGLKADLVVFRPESVRAHATFESPQEFATGYRAVLVNGIPTVLDDRVTGLPGGDVLLRS